MQARRLFFVLSLALLTAASCNKPVTLPDPVNGAPHTFELQFNNSTMPIASVDSVVAVFKKLNSLNPILKKLDRHNTRFVTDTDGLSAGEYDVSVYVYTKKEPTVHNSYMYRLTKRLVLPAQTTALGAPLGKLIDEWLPAIVVRDEAKGLTVIIGERQDDPYLEIRVPPAFPYKQVYVDRAAYGPNYLVDQDSWLPTQNPFNGGVVYDSTAFAAYANRMKTKDYTRAEIYFLLVDNLNNESVFLHEFAKRP